jgi:hypothetical protein
MSAGTGFTGTGGPKNIRGLPVMNTKHHIYKILCKRHIDTRMRSLLTLGTNPAQRKPTKLAQGNPQCWDQFHKLYVNNIHCRNGQHPASPYIPAEAGEFD